MERHRFFFAKSSWATQKLAHVFIFAILNRHRDPRNENHFQKERPCHEASSIPSSSEHSHIAQRGQRGFAEAHFFTFPGQRIRTPSGNASQ